MVTEPRDERPAARPGRCSVHPGAVEIGRCEVCGRALCVSCAVPVRGAILGSECLSVVLEDRPGPLAPAVPERSVGDLPAIIGFGLVVALSVVPWSRYGDASGFFQGWSLHWSLLSVGAAAAGLVVTLVFRRHPRDPRLEAAILAGLAVLVATGAILHALRPPALSRVWMYAWVLPVASSALVILGAARKLAAAYERPPIPSRPAGAEHAERT